MSHTAGSVARHGFGFGVLAVATLGLIVSAPAPVVDVVGCAHATIAAADTAGATMHETDCASIASAIADACSSTLASADTGDASDAFADVASAAHASADMATITVEEC